MKGSFGGRRIGNLADSESGALYLHGPDTAQVVSLEADEGSEWSIVSS